MKDNGVHLPSIKDAIRFRIEQYGHTTREMSKRTGINEHHLSEVLSGKIGISRSMQWKLYKYGIPAVVLIQPPIKE